MGGSGLVGLGDLWVAATCQWVRFGLWMPRVYWKNHGLGRAELSSSTVRRRLLGPLCPTVSPCVCVRLSVCSCCCGACPQKLPATFNSAGAEITFASQLLLLLGLFAAARLIQFLQYNGIRRRQRNAGPGVPINIHIYSTHIHMSLWGFSSRLQSVWKVHHLTFPPAGLSAESPFFKGFSHRKELEKCR